MVDLPIVKLIGLAAEIGIIALIAYFSFKEGQKFIKKRSKKD